MKNYYYLGNADPWSDNIAIVFFGNEYFIGEVIPISDFYYARIAPFFLLEETADAPSH